MKLSNAQRTALVALADGSKSSYEARVSLATLHALEKKGLVRGRYGLGSMAFPQTSTIWSLTDAGRAQVEE